MILSAQFIAHHNKEKNKIKDLSDVEFSVFSQWGEDGILSWLIDNIGRVPGSFVEFGVQNYVEANTRYLLFDRNWSGLIIDGSEDNIAEIKSSYFYWRFDLQAKQAFITAENINSLFGESGFEGELGVLSIDIDGNDFWVWKAISSINPIIVVLEYNAVLGDRQSITIPYDPEFVRSNRHFSHLYFGASLKALCDLANEKGYKFVGTNSNGVNAFFVRSDHAKNILNKINTISAYPSKFREARNRKGLLTYERAQDRLSAIQDCEFIDLSKPTSRTLLFKNLKNTHSDSWLAGEKSVL